MPETMPELSVFAASVAVVSRMSFESRLLWLFSVTVKRDRHGWMYRDSVANSVRFF